MTGKRQSNSDERGQGKMKKVKVTVDLCRSVYERVIEVPDDATEDEIEGIAREEVFEIVEWHWDLVDENCEAED